MLAGKLTVRHPGGETELGPGDLACFPNGPDGAHKLTNKGAENGAAGRVLDEGRPEHGRLSRQRQDRRLAAAGGGDEDAIRVRRESKVDYWDREVD